MKSVRKPDQTGLGIFQRVRETQLPAVGYVGRPPPSIGARTAIGAVPVPGDEKRRHKATVNLRDDILMQELRHGRISEAAYRVGRTVQAAYEGIREKRRDELNDKVDQSTTPDDAMVANLTLAQRVVKLQRHIEKLVGVVGTRFLRAVLVEGLSFEQYAEARGRGGRTAAQHAGDRFRWMLESLAESWAASGEA